MKKAAKIQTTLRIPESMHDWLCGEAEDNGRTVNGEVLFRLKKMMEKENAEKQHA